MSELKDPRPMTVSVTSISPGDSAGSCVAEMIVDGSARSFRFEARGRLYLSTERSFDDIFEHTMGVQKIFQLIGRYLDGEPISFPVDIAELLDFKHLLAAGGPPPPNGATGAARHEPDPDET